jgi:transposase InsO family protein
LAQQIQTIHTQSRQTYGSPRIVAVLRQQGHRHCRNRVARRMREAGLQGRQRRRYCVHTTDMESFWSTLKWELVYRRDFATRTQARTEIFDYIEVFYNRQRLHSALGYCSPVDFELKITNY